MVIIVNVIGIAAGAVVLVMTMANLIAPSIAPDALLMKHLIFFFGHVFINANDLLRRDRGLPNITALHPAVRGR